MRLISAWWELITTPGSDRYEFVLQVLGLAELVGSLAMLACSRALHVSGVNPALCIPHLVGSRRRKLLASNITLACHLTPPLPVPYRTYRLTAACRRGARRRTGAGKDSRGGTCGHHRSPYWPRGAKPFVTPAEVSGPKLKQALLGDGVRKSSKDFCAQMLRGRILDKKS